MPADDPVNDARQVLLPVDQEIEEFIQAGADRRHRESQPQNLIGLIRRPRSFCTSFGKGNTRRAANYMFHLSFPPLLSPIYSVLNAAYSFIIISQGLYRLIVFIPQKCKN